MKKLLLNTLLLSSSTLLAQSELDLKLGIVALNSSTPYVGYDSKNYILPAISLKYGDFYLEGLEAGFKLYSDDGAKVSVFTSVSFLGYDSNESPFLNDMSDRDMDIQTGLKFSYDIGADTLSLRASTDLYNTHDGYSFELKYIHKLLVSEQNLLYVYGGLDYLSDKKSTYYYGVRAQEATAARAFYELSDTTTPFIGVRNIYLFNEKLSLVANAKYSKLDNSIEDSPIVDDGYEFSAFAALMYRY
jgi:MipA family protein